MARPQQMNPAQAANMNAALRQQLIAISPVSEKPLGTFTAPAGGQIRVKLLNAGILTKIMLAVTVPVTIGTATGVPSIMAPYNLIQRVRLTDYNGQDRVSLTGFELFMVNSRRKRRAAYGNQGANANVTVNPLVPTAVGAANMRFFLEVPIAYDVDNPLPQLRDLRGAIYSQTNVGEMYLTIDFIGAGSAVVNGNSDGLYQGAGTTTVSLGTISTEVVQVLIAPQAIDGRLPLPVMDFETVYEILGAQTTNDNIVNGQEKLISFPNVRSNIAMHLGVFNNSLMAAGVISKFALLANGTTRVKEESEFMALMMQREALGGSDLVPGAYILDYSDRPIDTLLFGQVQLGLTPGIALTTPKINFCTEAMYRQNSALPGVLQSG